MYTSSTFSTTVSFTTTLSNVAIFDCLINSMLTVSIVVPSTAVTTTGTVVLLSNKLKLTVTVSPPVTSS